MAPRGPTGSGDKPLQSGNEQGTPPQAFQAVQQDHVTARAFPASLTALALVDPEKPKGAVENEPALARPPSVRLGPAPGPARTPAPGAAP